MKVVAKSDIDFSLYSKPTTRSRVIVIYFSVNRSGFRAHISALSLQFGFYGFVKRVSSNRVDSKVLFAEPKTKEEDQNIIAFLNLITQLPEYTLLDEDVQPKELSQNQDLLRFMHQDFVVYKVAQGVCGNCFNASDDPPDSWEVTSRHSGHSSNT